MARRAFRGPLIREGVQTGDGRFIVDGAMSSQSLPMPLAYLKESMHGSVSFGGPQIGTIETWERQDDGTLWGTGFIDDADPDGAKLIEKLEAGTASMGTRHGVSVDPDNYEVDLLIDWGDDEDGFFAADAKTAFSSRGADCGSFVMGGSRVRAALKDSPLVAAAGDGDPADEDGYELLFTARVDEFMERYTMLRARGATAVDTPAFADCWIELDPDADEGGADGTAADPEPVAAAAGPARPPAAWFANPELEGPTPLTITDDGQVFGHGACWGTCHTGYSDICVPPPRASDQYGNFLTGTVVTDDGQGHAVGTLVWGIPHADTDRPLTRNQVIAHYYADSTFGWADVSCGEDEHGIWVAGALRPHVTDEDVRTLRALKLSGDWRPRPGTKALDLLAFSAVNVQGFTVPHHALAAAAGPALGAPIVAFDDDGAITALVAAPAPVHRAEGAASDELFKAVLAGQREILKLAKTLEMRTRWQRDNQAEALRTRLNARD